MIGYAFCGSFCTHEASLAVLAELLARGYPITPIFSETAYQTDTKFGKAAAIVEKVEAMCGREITHTIPAAERFGPTTPLDTLIIAPCTGNTLAKLAHGITDTAVCMSAKSPSAAKQAAAHRSCFQRRHVGKPGKYRSSAEPEKHLLRSHAAGRPRKEASFSCGGLFHDHPRL